MNLHWIDWTIIGAMLAFMLGIAIRTKFLNRSVADFLVGNRCAGRYLLTMASGMSGLGAITIAANFEKFYASGFAGVWWGQILVPLSLILALSGFVIYRYRETRAMTMAQFFEMRYGRRFRIFAGLLAFISGILNYGIFPAVTARFLIYFCGLPEEVQLFGFTVSMLAVVMFCLLSMALILTLSGGQIAVIITDFFQGQFVQVAILIIFFFMLSQISWSELIAGLQMAPEQESRINPFKQGDTIGFNPAFFFILAALQVYGYKAWQGSQGYNACPKSPHEAKMAGILGEFRGQVIFLLSMLIPVFVFAMMHLPEFSSQAEAVHATLATIENPQIQGQMLVPTGVSQLLPVGIMGLFAAVVVAAAVSTDDTYLHSWGSIFIQDVVMPFRNKPLGPRMHMFLLRGSILGVAVFAFIFSLTFPLNEFIYMYFQITGAIFLGGAGAVILGGLYWKRGSVEGAWAAMSVGSLLAVGGIVLRNIVWPRFLPDWKLDHPERIWLQELPEKFPFDGVQMSLAVAIIAASSYVLFSLLSKRPPVNMEKLLHRGEYQVEDYGHHPSTEASRPGVALPLPSRLSRKERMYRRLGINDDFTRGDRFIYFFKIGFALFFFGAFVLGTVLGLTVGISDDVWISWWSIQVFLTIFIGVVATVWFVIGGFRDLADLTRTLKSLNRDAADDGSVRGDEHLQEGD
tara:strand:- start:12672 stop:14732 length:2061 start_codon:yes stop_codon:yes gene_type:complete